MSSFSPPYSFEDIREAVEGKGVVGMTNYYEELFNVLFNLYVSTWTYHWNVKGTNFYQCHKMLEGQYKKLGKFVDKVAEMVRGDQMPIYPPKTLQFKPTHNKREIKNDLMEKYNTLLQIIADRPTLDIASETTIGDLAEYLKKQRWFISSTMM